MEEQGEVNRRLGSMRLGPPELSALLSGAPFLDGMSPDVIASVAQACELVEVPDEASVIRLDEPNDSLYVVVYGGLRTITRDAKGRERVVSRAYRGDSVGMTGLLPRLSTPMEVVAFRDSLLLRLTRARFAPLASRDPELMERLAEALVRRSLRLLQGQPQWVTWSRPRAAAHDIALLLPSQDRYFTRPVAELAVTAFERYRSVGLVTAELVDQALGERASATLSSDPRNRELLALLHKLEVGREVVLYQCDTSAGAWTQRCLRQADRILVIVRADRADHFADIRPVLEPALERRNAPPIDVAVVHTDRAEVPQRAIPEAAWLLNRANCHHVRMGERPDYERVVRTLMREGVALVLSGGGARGIAHVGVIKALEDAGVPIDAIAGASMGSIFAAGYARGWGADKMMPRVRTLFGKRMALYDPTLPLEALLAGRKLERVLRSYYEDLDIENLWIPFFCISTNLSRAEPKVHDRGRLLAAVVASCSIPGIFPPRRHGKDWLVDGGVMNNLPVDVMAARFDGEIIASDVTLVSDDTPARRRAGPMRRMVRSLRRRRRGGVESLGILETLARSSMVGSRYATFQSLERDIVSLHLQLPVSRFGTLDWGAYDELFKVGYEFASARLRDWWPSCEARRCPPEEAERRRAVEARSDSGTMPGAP